MNLVDNACTLGNSEGSVEIDIPDWKKRVVAEREELNKKIAALTSFVDTEPFNKLGPRDKRLLKTQLVFMREYAYILSQRLEDYAELDPAEIVSAHTAPDDGFLFSASAINSMVSFRSDEGQVAQLVVIEGRLELVGDLPISESARMFMEAIKPYLAEHVQS